MNEQANVQAVRQMYDAFGRGDIQAILNQLAEDIEWFQPGTQKIPTAGRRRGREQVRQFFATVSQTYAFDRFEPRDYIAQGDRVVVLGSYAGTVKPTGRKFTSDWAMAWLFRNGKAVTFQEYTDTEALEIALAGSGQPAAARR